MDVLDDITNQIENDIPTATDNANIEYQDQQITHSSATSETNEKLVDKYGASFNPNLHKINDDGTPKKSAKGLLCLKPGKRKVSNAIRQDQNHNKPIKSILSTDFTNKANDQDSIQLSDQIRKTAIITTDSLITISVIIMGEEWKPFKNAEYQIDERENLIDCFTTYFKENGIVDLPPNLALTLGLCGYALPRFTMPGTQARFKKLFNLKKKKEEVKSENES